MPDFKGLPDAAFESWLKQSDLAMLQASVQTEPPGPVLVNRDDILQMLRLIDALAGALRDGISMQRGKCEHGYDEVVWAFKRDADIVTRAKALLAHTGLGGDDGKRTDQAASRLPASDARR